MAKKKAAGRDKIMATEGDAWDVEKGLIRSTRPPTGKGKGRKSHLPAALRHDLEAAASRTANHALRRRAVHQGRTMSTVTASAT